MLTEGIKSLCVECVAVFYHFTQHNFRFGEEIHVHSI